MLSNSQNEGLSVPRALKNGFHCCAATKYSVSVPYSMAVLRSPSEQYPAVFAAVLIPWVFSR
jgi:hypothetical protein